MNTRSDRAEVSVIKRKIHASRVEHVVQQLESYYGMPELANELRNLIKKIAVQLKEYRGSLRKLPLSVCAIERTLHKFTVEQIYVLLDMRYGMPELAKELSELVGRIADAIDDAEAREIKNQEKMR